MMGHVVTEHGTRPHTDEERQFFTDYAARMKALEAQEE